MNKTGKKRQPRRVSARSLEVAALAHLQRYSTSAANLRAVLMRRVWRAAQANGDDPAEGAVMVDALIERYLRSGLLNDADYAAARATTLHRRGASSRGIRLRLAEKGVDGDQIDQVLENLEDETGGADIRGAFNFAKRRRLGPWRRSDRESHRDRDMAALGRQGYSFEIVRRIVDADSVAGLESDIEAD
jgi:regulatory protein